MRLSSSSDNQALLAELGFADISTPEGGGRTGCTASKERRALIIWEAPPAVQEALF